MLNFLLNSENETLMSKGRPKNMKIDKDSMCQF